MSVLEGVRIITVESLIIDSNELIENSRLTIIREIMSKRFSVLLKEKFFTLDSQSNSLNKFQGVHMSLPT